MSIFSYYQGKLFMFCNVQEANSTVLSNNDIYIINKYNIEEFQIMIDTKHNI